MTYDHCGNSPFEPAPLFNDLPNGRHRLTGQHGHRTPFECSRLPAAYPACRTTHLWVPLFVCVLRTILCLRRLPFPTACCARPTRLPCARCSVHFFLLSRICGLTPVREVVPACDKGPFPSRCRY